MGSGASKDAGVLPSPSPARPHDGLFVAHLSGVPDEDDGVGGGNPSREAAPTLVFALRPIREGPHKIMAMALGYDR